MQTFICVIAPMVKSSVIRKLSPSCPPTNPAIKAKLFLRKRTTSHWTSTLRCRGRRIKWKTIKVAKVALIFQLTASSSVQVLITSEIWYRWLSLLTAAETKIELFKGIYLRILNSAWARQVIHTSWKAILSSQSWRKTYCTRQIRPICSQGWRARPRAPSVTLDWTYCMTRLQSALTSLPSSTTRCQDGRKARQTQPMNAHKRSTRVVTSPSQTKLCKAHVNRIFSASVGASKRLFMESSRKRRLDRISIHYKGLRAATLSTSEVTWRASSTLIAKKVRRLARPNFRNPNWTCAVRNLEISLVRGHLT